MVRACQRVCRYHEQESQVVVEGAPGEMDRLGATVEDLAQAREIFGELRADAAGTLEKVRDLARGFYPPLLADLGLYAATIAGHLPVRSGGLDS